LTDERVFIPRIWEANRRGNGEFERRERAMVEDGGEKSERSDARNMIANGQMRQVDLRSDGLEDPTN
jgi:hypothetical protein